MPVICEISPITGDPVYNIFTDIRGMWNWKSVNGDNDEMNFYLTDDIYVSCRKFERCRQNPSSSSISATIVLVCNGSESEMYSCTASFFKATSRYYSIRSGAILQLGSGRYDYEEDVIGHSNTCLAFAVLEAVNKITGETSAGIYVPKSHGSISRETRSGQYVYEDVDFDPTPYIWTTEEMSRIVPNTGLAFMSGKTIDQTGTIAAKSALSGSGYVDITINGDIPGVDLVEKQFSTIDGSYIVSASIAMYDHTAHTITIQIAAESYEHIVIGASYTIADVEYPVMPTWIPIFGLGSECISSGAYVRLQGTGTASSGLGGLWA